MHKDLYLTFVDLEKAYDRVPMDMVYWYVSEKERGPRDASEGGRNNIPWSINSSENHAWQN